MSGAGRLASRGRSKKPGSATPTVSRSSSRTHAPGQALATTRPRSNGSGRSSRPADCGRVSRTSPTSATSRLEPDDLRRTRELLVETVHACDAARRRPAGRAHRGRRPTEPRRGAAGSRRELPDARWRKPQRVRVVAELMAGTTARWRRSPRRRRSSLTAVADDRLGLRARYRAPVRRRRAARRAGRRRRPLRRAPCTRARFEALPRPRERLGLRTWRPPGPSRRHRRRA